MYREIKKCRICGNPDLVSILHLGNQYLTGVFPKSKNEIITSGPIELLKCQEDKKGEFCGLVQLKQSYNLKEMYGSNYGYRSGLNRSMVEHLRLKVKSILQWFDLKSNDIIVDIGSNDSTLLQAYPQDGLTLIGIDPTIEKFKEYYPENIVKISKFFSSGLFKKHFGKKKARIITAIAMFYDIENPLDFMKQIFDILSDNGIFIIEQSYLLPVIENNAYDTICHEHLEYYRLKQIKWMADRVGFKIIDIEFNKMNGGSFSTILAKSDFISIPAKTALVDKILREEDKKGLNNIEIYHNFRERVFKHRSDLLRFINKLNDSNILILGYGASTKGNVLLQFCGLTAKDIPFIGEINEDKFGSYTPGTHIPIISEKEAKAMNPDYFLIFPWHFKEYFLKKERIYLKNGGMLLMPLPKVQVITDLKNIRHQNLSR